MIALAFITAALVVAAAAVGHALWALAGLRGWNGAAPAVGMAALMIVARWGAELPGRVSTAAAFVGALTVLGLVAAARWRRSDAAGRRGVRGADAAERVVLGALVVLGTLLPFLVAGRAGILGMGNNNDMSAHLTAAWWLGTHGDPSPVAATGDHLVTQGYPLGPHALAAALSRITGVSLVQTFDAVTMVGPALAALAVLELMPAAAPRVARVAGAALAGLAYLPVSYLVQGAFKEVLLGALLVATAVTLRAIERASAEARSRLANPRAGTLLAVLGAGCVYVYSAPGALWPAAAVVLWLVLTALSRRPVRPLLPAVAGAIVAGIVLLVPEAPHLHDFLDSSFANEPKEGLGNLSHAIPAAEALNIWLRGDFRHTPHPYAITIALDAIAVCVLAGALVWTWRRRQLAPLAAFAAAGAMALQSWILRSPYNTAKGLAVLGATVAMILAPALAAAYERRRKPAPRRGARPVVIALASIVALGAAASSFAALRHGPVGTTHEEAELQSLARTIGDRPVLYTGVEDFAQWHLRGTKVFTGPLLYSPHIAHTWPRKQWLVGQPFDPDMFAGRTLDAMDFVITTSAPYRSALPPNFAEVRRTPDFVLWRRAGRTPARLPIEARTRIGRTLNCASPRGRRILRHGGAAVVVPQPVFRSRRIWRGLADEAGASASATLTVPAGAWDVSLQYVGNSGFTLRAPGLLRAELAPRMSRLGAYWPAGRISLARPTRVTLTATARDPSALGTFLGAPARTRALNFYTHAPLGGLALTRRGLRPRTVPLPAACGRFVDHLVPGGAASATRRR